MKIVASRQFNKDYKKAKKQARNLELLKQLIDLISSSSVLPDRYKDHQLTGNFKAFRESHILPDWLLIYRISNNILYLERFGSHSELF